MLVDEAGYVAIKYFNTREEYLAKQAPLGSVDLRTMDKFTYSGDLIYFEAFQVIKQSGLSLSSVQSIKKERERQKARMRE